MSWQRPCLDWHAGRKPAVVLKPFWHVPVRQGRQFASCTRLSAGLMDVTGWSAPGCCQADTFPGLHSRMDLHEPQLMTEFVGWNKANTFPICMAPGRPWGQYIAALICPKMIVLYPYQTQSLQDHL